MALAAGFALFGLSLYRSSPTRLGDGEQFQFELRWPWIENVGFLGDNGITLHLGVDGIAAPMVLLNGVVDVRRHADLLQDRVPEQGLLHPVLVLVAGVFGVFVSLDLFFWFFFYELAVLPMYLLIGVWGASSVFPTFVRTKEYSALKLTLVLVGASVLIFIGIFAVFVEAGAGTFDLPALYAHATGLRPELPEDRLPALPDRLRRAGRPLAVPHLVAGRPRRRADGRSACCTRAC